MKDGKMADWCFSAWCYVDMCNCELPTGLYDVKAQADPSVPLPHLQWQGHPIFYSEATCGVGVTYDAPNDNSKDPREGVVTKFGMWSSEECKKKVDEAKWGKAECACIGFVGLPGKVPVMKGGEPVDYDASFGATCGAWDDGVDPRCKAPGKPSWCEAKWCFVDPCSCEGGEPAASAYLPGVTFR